MSSVSTQTCGCLCSTAPSAINSAREYTAPVGLDGEFSISHFVRGVMLASSCAGVSLKPASRGHSTTIGTPPVSLTISGYDTQQGAGTITSSPGFNVAKKALKIACLAPAEMLTSSGA